jgi:hypothetical protein
MEKINPMQYGTISHINHFRFHYEKLLKIVKDFYHPKLVTDKPEITFSDLFEIQDQFDFLEILPENIYSLISLPKASQKMYYLRTSIISAFIFLYFEKNFKEYNEKLIKSTLAQFKEVLLLNMRMLATEKNKFSCSSKEDHFWKMLNSLEGKLTIFIFLDLLKGKFPSGNFGKYNTIYSSGKELIEQDFQNLDIEAMINKVKDQHEKTKNSI